MGTRAIGNASCPPSRVQPPGQEGRIAERTTSRQLSSEVAVATTFCFGELALAGSSRCLVYAIHAGDGWLLRPWALFGAVPSLTTRQWASVTQFGRSASSLWVYVGALAAEFGTWRGGPETCMEYSIVVPLSQKSDSSTLLHAM